MNWKITLSAIAIVCATMAGCARDEEMTTTASLAITGVDIIDVESGELLGNRTILIDSGRILDVVPADEFEPPQGVRLIDGRGKYAMPGLWDMHIHI